MAALSFALALLSIGWLPSGMIVGLLFAICVVACALVYRRNRHLWKENRELEKRVEQAVADLDQTRKALGREHDRLRFIFDAIPTGVALSQVKPDGTMTRWVNRAQWSICGLKVREGEDVDFFDVTHPEDRLKQEALHRRLEAGELDHYSLEKRYIRPDGETVWVIFTVERRRFEDGGYEDLSTVVDVTALTRVQEEAANERELLRTLLEHCPDYIYFKDLESRFLKTSRSHAECVGVDSPEEMIGKTDFDFFPQMHAQETFAAEQEIIRTGTPMIGRIEKEMHSSRDGDCWMIATKMPLRNPEGEIVGTFGVSRDITSIKRAEAELELTHQRLLEASRQAGMAEVATSVLHNVGNVLNSVNVSASMVDERIRRSKSASIQKLSGLLNQHAHDLGGFLTENPQGRQIPAFVQALSEHIRAEREEVLAEVKSLRAKIDHIKEIVAMQQSYAKTSGVVEELSVVELVEDALSMTAAGFNRHGVQVIRDFRTTPTVATDRHKVLQVLVNVLRNAKQACFDTNLQEKTVTIRISGGEESVEIVIEDNGVGISPDNLPRIFTHGFTTKKEGHGFGLHSGALAIQELGGTFTVDSEGLGKGARFVIKLPAPPSSAT